MLLQFGNGVEVSGKGGCVITGLRSADDDHDTDGEHLMMRMKMMVSRWLAMKIKVATGQVKTWAIGHLHL